MEPDLHRIQHAAGADELLSVLAKFISYVRSDPVCGLLPDVLRNISVTELSEVARWQDRIEGLMQQRLPLDASTHFWLSELNEVLKAARLRIEELMPDIGSKPSSAMH
jgi:hypothetical protein